MVISSKPSKNKISCIISTALTSFFLFSVNKIEITGVYLSLDGQSPSRKNWSRNTKAGNLITGPVTTRYI